MEQTERRRLHWAKSDIIVLVVQLVTSIVFAYLVKKVLPFKYWIVVALLLALACALVCRKVQSLVGRIARSKRQRLRDYLSRKKKRVKILSGVLSFILALVSVVASQGLGALSTITGGSYQTQVISVIVKAESSYQELKDMDGKKLGLVQGLDKENTEKALEEIQNKEKVSVTTVGSSSVVGLSEALLNEKVDAMLLNEAYRGLIEDSNGTFSNDTRIIYQYEIKQELNLFGSNKKVTKESFNIYLSGIDTYGSISTVSRSDVNMIVTVNPKTKQILMTSIPRDYYVELASYGEKDKLTHAGIYGVEESMATLENLFGIEIDYYARVNFTSLINIVDALGGITVYNDQAFTSYHTYDYYPEGNIDMDGETALEFVRERYGLSGGDNDRVKNQQKVLKALIDKAISPAIIKNYSQLLDAASESVVTSMSSKDIQSIIQMQLNDMSSWEIQQVSVTGTGSSSSSCYSMKGTSVYVMEPDYQSVNEAAAKIEEVMDAE